MKPIAWHMEARRLTLDAIVAGSGLDRNRVRSIVGGNYIPSPAERRLLAEAVGLPVEEIAWDHAVPVDHIRGHGPQFGRSP